MVDPESDVAVGVQLNWRLRTLILTGQLRSGEALPSVRRLAAWAGVNANTVRSVYDSLHEQGLIEARQGKGTYVSEGTVARPELESIALEAVMRGERSGVDPRDLAVAVMACAEMLSAVPSPPHPDSTQGREGLEADTLEVRSELRRQIAELEAELAAYVRDLPPGDLPTAPHWSEAHISGVEELEHVRDTLFAKLFKARRAATDRATDEAAARSAREREPAAGGPFARAMSWWQSSMGTE